MEGHVSPGEYKDVVLFLATAGVIVPLFRRWRISPILGFLGAGVVLGPFGLGALSGAFPWLGYFTIANPGEIAQLAEFGVVFLLFMIGLELSWERLRLMRRWVFGMGALQVTLCLAVIAAAAMAMGLAPAPAPAGSLGGGGSLRRASPQACQDSSWRWALVPPTPKALIAARRGPSAGAHSRRSVGT